MTVEFSELVERTLDECLPAAGTRPAALCEAMRYAVGSGGKRLRPLVCLNAAIAVGGRAEDARHPAAAIEILHNYTLIHDDLPAMDNDVERRGKPTVWKKFGEAEAILAGDALLALAFRVAAKAPRNADAVVEALGDAGVGVVLGQADELSAMRGGASGSATDDDFAYRRKTADLFVAAAAMGALAAGGSAADVARLREYALRFGLAFQYADDLADGDGLFTRETAESRVAEHAEAALAALSGLPGDVSFLESLAKRVASPCGFRGFRV